MEDFIIPNLLFNDSFWTTTINYLSLRDLFNLKLTCKLFCGINMKKELSNTILNKLISIYGENAYKVKEFMIKYNVLLTGKFFNNMFKSTDHNCFSQVIEFVLIISKNIIINKNEIEFHLGKYETIRWSPARCDYNILRKLHDIYGFETRYINFDKNYIRLHTNSYFPSYTGNIIMNCQNSYSNNLHIKAIYFRELMNEL